ncbi:MAG TPA: CHRD domain-containing protein [Phnomibacter sp.]|nr:CHRD domain-containing protein [Phnomibacter sp.]
MKKFFLAAIMSPFAVLFLMGCQKSMEKFSSPDALSMGNENKNDNGTIWVMNVQLSGLNEVPTNTAGATGVAILRLTKDSVLHSKVKVDAPEAVGNLTAAHIHEAAAGVNGPVRIFLCHNADEFGMNMETKLTPAQYTILTTAAHLYVNAHSVVFPAGVARGQIR